MLILCSLPLERKMHECQPVDHPEFSVPMILKTLSEEAMDAYLGKGYEGKKASMKNAGFVITICWVVMLLLCKIAWTFVQLSMIVAVVIGVVAAIGIVASVFFTVVYFGNVVRLVRAERGLHPYRIRSELNCLQDSQMYYTNILYFNMATLEACAAAWNLYAEHKAAGKLPKSVLRESQVREMLVRRIDAMKRVLDRIEVQGIEIVDWQDENAQYQLAVTMKDNPLTSAADLWERSEELQTHPPLTMLFQLYEILMVYESSFGYVNRHLLSPSS